MFKKIRKEDPKDTVQAKEDQAAPKTRNKQLQADWLKLVRLESQLVASAQRACDTGFFEQCNETTQLEWLNSLTVQGEPSNKIKREIIYNFFKELQEQGLTLEAIRDNLSGKYSILTSQIAQIYSELKQEMEIENIANYSGPMTRSKI